MNNNLTLPANISEYDFTISLFRHPNWLLRFLDSGFHESFLQDAAAKALIKAARHLYQGHYYISVYNMVGQLERQHNSDEANNKFLLKVLEVKEKDSDDALMLYRCFDNWQRRQAIAALQDAIEMIDCAITDTDSFVRKAIADLYKLQLGNDTITESAGRNHQALLEELAGKQEGPGHPPVSSGFTMLDQYTGGLHSGSLWLAAATAGTGCTSFVLNIIRNVLATENTVLVVSLTHNRQVITNSILAMESGVAFEKLMQKEINDDQAAQVYQCAETLALNKCHIADEYFNTSHDLLIYLYKAVPKFKSRIVVIDGWEWDHPQQTSGVQKINNDLLRQLKELAQRLGITVVLTAPVQFERYDTEVFDEEGNPDTPLMFNVCRLRNLYENNISPGLVDVALTIFRPEYYDISISGARRVNEAMVKLLRNQHGQLTTINFEVRQASGRWCECNENDNRKRKLTDPEFPY